MVNYNYKPRPSTEKANIEGLEFIIRLSEFRTVEDFERVDKEVLSKCKIIFQAMMDARQKIHSKACCCLAEFRGCVCDVSFKCQ